ncbi:hypothetical protein Fot_14151 [Forsythia ovata]|uniref:Uncharacterized protein n=1 Tax=Forsythia ovata TaxID=205694 RepID=A0ABD1W5H9_9LAMI
MEEKLLKNHGKARKYMADLIDLIRYDVSNGISRYYYELGRRKLVHVDGFNWSAYRASSYDNNLLTRLMEYFVDRNLVTESKVSSRSTLPKIDIVYDALDDEHKKLFLNSCFEKLTLVPCSVAGKEIPKDVLVNSCLTPESRAIAEVLDDLQLCVRCTLHASLKEKKQEHVRLFVLDTRREDPILDVYLHEDRGDGAVGDEELDDVFKDI